jgi:hypothetical protein
VRPTLGTWMNVIITALGTGACFAFIGALVGVRPSRWFLTFLVTAVLVAAIGVAAVYYSAQGAP